MRTAPTATSARKSTQAALKEYFGSETKARRVGALAAFYGALGLGRMQHGLGWHGVQLRKRVLHDKRLHIYPGGRADIRGRRVDPRVLITVEYLANATGSVRVSSLVSGHRLFTASGGVSAHVYGRAVDVTAVGGVRIKNHQGPGSVTERTVRLLLLLPAAHAAAPGRLADGRRRPDGQPRLVRAARSQQPHPDRVLKT